MNSVKAVGVKTQEMGKEFIMDLNKRHDPPKCWLHINLWADSVANLEGDDAVASALSTAIVLVKCNLTVLLGGGQNASLGDWPITAFPMASVLAFLKGLLPWCPPLNFWSRAVQNAYWRFSLPYQTAVWHSANFSQSSFQNFQVLSGSLLREHLELDYCRRERWFSYLFFSLMAFPCYTFMGFLIISGTDDKAFTVINPVMSKYPDTECYVIILV